MKKALLATICTLFAYYNYAQIRVIYVAHSHNDYTRKRPLYDALENGFASIEIDVFERNGKFLVAHTILGIRKHKTIERMYLEPLKQLVNENNGSVYKNDTTLLEIMIDLKGEWNEEKFKLLQKLLWQYNTVFSFYENGNFVTKACKLLVSGGGNMSWFQNDNPRLFSKDAGLGDISSNISTQFIARNSASYKGCFTWKGRGEMPEFEKQKLIQLCDEAKKYNRKIRFWRCPNNEKVWKELLDAGIGWVNVDKLKKFKEFYWHYYNK